MQASDINLVFEVRNLEGIEASREIGACLHETRKIPTKYHVTMNNFMIKHYLHRYHD